MNFPETNKKKKSFCCDPEIDRKLREEMIVRLQRGERCTISSLINERLADSYNIL